jgi:hypothetical protein
MKITDARLRNLVRLRLLEQAGAAGTGGGERFSAGQISGFATELRSKLNKQFVSSGLVDAGAYWALTVKIGRYRVSVSKPTGALKDDAVWKGGNITSAVRNVIRTGISGLDRKNIPAFRALQFTLSTDAGELQALEIPDKNQTPPDVPPVPRPRRSRCIRTVQEKLNKMYTVLWNEYLASTEPDDIALVAKFPNGPTKDGRPVFPLGEDNIVGKMTQGGWKFITGTELPPGPYTDDNCPEPTLPAEEEIEIIQDGPCIKVIEKSGINCALLEIEMKRARRGILLMSQQLQTIKMNTDAYYDDYAGYFDAGFERNTGNWDRYMGIQRGGGGRKGLMLQRAGWFMKAMIPIMDLCELDFFEDGGDKYISPSKALIDSAVKTSRDSQRIWGEWETGWFNDPDENDGQAAYSKNKAISADLETASSAYTSATSAIRSMLIGKTKWASMTTVATVPGSDPDAIRPGDERYAALVTLLPPGSDMTPCTDTPAVQGGQEQLVPEPSPGVDVIEDLEEQLVLKNLRKIY